MQFIEAMNFTKTDKRNIRLIVMHSMEMANRPRGASDVANWFAGNLAPKYLAPRASAHFCVDADSIVQCVRLKDVAWHAPGANNDGIGIELAGFARQTKEEWLSGRNLAELKLAARLVRTLCNDFMIPIQFLGTADITDKSNKGITTHWAVSLAFRLSNHIDPGGNFPHAEFIQFIRDSDPLDTCDSPKWGLLTYPYLWARSKV